MSHEHEIHTYETRVHDVCEHCLSWYANGDEHPDVTDDERRARALAIPAGGVYLASDFPAHPVFTGARCWGCGARADLYVGAVKGNHGFNAAGMEVPR